MVRVPNEEINNCDDVNAAVQRYESEGKSDPNEERYIINRAVELGCSEHIPDEWGIQ